ncbi:unnamed protein product [Schistosoma margrebowiei]|uniref:Uncharacterized protein n=1 Tax=Schistosoma margrebowiei TaxID=48269 RepID=A0A183MB40_9TREM|nr:unnamed protein product [Schistosoma margrebowiei]
MSSNVSEAVIHDAPSDPEMSISETCPVIGSNPIAPETLLTNTGLSSSQKDDVLLNVHEIIAVPVQKETENESSIIMKTVAPNEAHHSAIEVPDESNYRDSLVLPENMSCASNNNQEPDAVLLDADYHSDPLSTSGVPHKFGHNISEESNFNHLISIVVQPQHSVTFSRSSVQCDKYVLDKFKLIISWAYEDPTLFRRGG